MLSTIDTDYKEVCFRIDRRKPLSFNSTCLLILFNE